MNYIFASNNRPAQLFDDACLNANATAGHTAATACDCSCRPEPRAQEKAQPEPCPLGPLLSPLARVVLIVHTGEGLSHRVHEVREEHRMPWTDDGSYTQMLIEMSLHQVLQPNLWCR